MQAKKKQTNQDELYGELGRAFNFTKGDLEANRAGFISHRQRKHIRNNFAGLFFLSLIIFLGLIGMTAFLAFSSQNAADKSTGFDTLTWFSAWMFGGCSIIAVGFLVNISRDFLKDYHNPRILSFTSKLKLKEVHHRRRSEYYLVSTHGNFLLSEKATQLAWYIQRNYSVYYMPNLNYILSIEEATNNEQEQPENTDALELNQHLQGKSAQ